MVEVVIIYMLYKLHFPLWCYLLVGFSLWIKSLMFFNGLFKSVKVEKVYVDNNATDTRDDDSE